MVGGALDLICILFALSVSCLDFRFCSYRLVLSWIPTFVFLDFSFLGVHAATFQC